MTGGQVVAGSNPVSPTLNTRSDQYRSGFRVSRALAGLRQCPTIDPTAKRGVMATFCRRADVRQCIKDRTAVDVEALRGVGRAADGRGLHGQHASRDVAR
jgi:hypothetical protein